MVGTPNRRKFLSLSGTAAIGGLAGCTSIGGGSQSEEITLAAAPGGLLGLIMDYLEAQTDILTTNMDEAGYDLTIERTYDDVSLFASGQSQFSAPAPVEASRLASEREIEITIHAVLTQLFSGFLARRGSPYDPAEAGSEEEAIAAMAENDARLNFGQWTGGLAPNLQVIMANMGYELVEGGGDFNVFTGGGFENVAEAIRQGQVDVGTGSPMTGAANSLVDDESEVVVFFYFCNQMQELGLGRSYQNTWTTRQSFAENHPEAVTALLDSWEEGLSWFLDDAENILMQEENWDFIDCENEEQAQAVYEWGVEASRGMNTPVLYEDFRMSDDRAQSITELVNTFAEDFNQAPGDWADWMAFESHQ
jgi:ABC-type nitrate/sulfonate/bicarbonate transport system substrate-binding protein